MCVLYDGECLFSVMSRVMYSTYCGSCRDDYNVQVHVCDISSLTHTQVGGKRLGGYNEAGTNGGKGRDMVATSLKGE